MNQIHTIHPYKYHGQWVFDDKSKGLDKEAFVSGADVILDELAKHLLDYEKGFTLLFSSSMFPSSTTSLFWERKEMNGNWYYSELLDMSGWLCPALFKYFDTAPKNIYIQIKGLYENIYSN